MLREIDLRRRNVCGGFLIKINHDNNVMISQKTNEFQIIIKPQKKKQGGL